MGGYNFFTASYYSPIYTSSLTTSAAISAQNNFQGLILGGYIYRYTPRRYGPECNLALTDRCEQQNGSRICRCRLPADRCSECTGRTCLGTARYRLEPSSRSSSTTYWGCRLPLLHHDHDLDRDHVCACGRLRIALPAQPATRRLLSFPTLLRRLSSTSTLYNSHTRL